MIKKTLCFTNPAYLSLQNGQIAIKLVDAEQGDAEKNIVRGRAERTVPIEDVGVVVLENRQITVTHGLLAALLENNCAVITCDTHGLPVGLLLPLSGNTVQTERFRDQIDVSLPLKKQLWQQTVARKIENQAAALAHANGSDLGCMHRWALDVRSGDPDNLEGRAAAFYWKNFFASIPEIEGFTRDRDGFPPNNLLNYGYAVLRAVVARALVSSGLLPTLGIHHHNRYNAYCLADDIMEPYRPYVDELVLDIVRTSRPEAPVLDRPTKIRLLGIPTLEVIIAGKRSPLMVAATQTTASLAKCFAGESRRIVYPEMKL